MGRGDGLARRVRRASLRRVGRGERGAVPTAGFRLPEWPALDAKFKAILSTEFHIKKSKLNLESSS